MVRSRVLLSAINGGASYYGGYWAPGRSYYGGGVYRRAGYYRGGYHRVRRGGYRVH